MADTDINTSMILIENSNFAGNQLDLPALIHAYRTLRNYCAKGRQEQSEIAKHGSSIISRTNDIFIQLLRKTTRDESEDLCFIIALQFLANYIVSNTENQLQVWDMCSKTIKECLLVGSGKSKTAAAMILYNMFLCHKTLYDKCEDSLTTVIKLCLDEETSEFAVFTIELVIQNSDYIPVWYNRLDIEDRLVVLGILSNMVDDRKNIPRHVIRDLIDFFNRKCDCVLRTASGNDGLGPQEIVRMLQFFNALCGNMEQLIEVQENAEILTYAVNLLRSVHEISKETGNNFSMLRKIADLQEAHVDEQHSGFSLKCSLIRLIGNLCYQCKRNQDRIRDLNGILLILDCSSIDGRNPLIIQWVILAMRNICEGNVENQRVVASVDHRGVVDTNSLNEFGIRLNDNDDGSSLGIAPLSAFKK